MVYMSKHAYEQPGIEIIGQGAALPDGRLSNEDLVDRFCHELPDLTPENIESRTGIRTRPYANPELNETTTSLAAAAGRAAIEGARVDPQDIKYLYIGTSTPDQRVPATAIAVQRELSISNEGFCADLSMACSAAANGLKIAYDSLANAEDGEMALVIGADRVSTLVDPRDFDTASIFADGAGAMLLRKNSKSQSGLIASTSITDGSQADLFHCPNGETITMQGKQLTARIVRMVDTLSSRVLGKAGITIDEIDYVVAHQPNGRIMNMIANKLGCPEEKLINIVRDYGNASAATVPLTFNHLAQSGKLERGQRLLFIGAAVGIAGTALVVEY